MGSRLSKVAALDKQRDRQTHRQNATANAAFADGYNKTVQCNIVK